MNQADFIIASTIVFDQLHFTNSCGTERFLFGVFKKRRWQANFIGVSNSPFYARLYFQRDKGNATYIAAIFYVETGDLLETFFRLWRLKGDLDTNHPLSKNCKFNRLSRKPLFLR
jgi:hypothetical protein